MPESQTARLRYKTRNPLKIGQELSDVRKAISVYEASQARLEAELRKAKEERGHD